MKIIVAHSGTQHSLRVAQALNDSGYDVTYITSVYNKKGGLTNMVSKFLRGDSKKRANNRTVDYFPEDRIVQVCEFYGLLMLVVKRFPHFRKLYYFMEDRMRTKFGKNVVKLSKDSDALIMFDTQAFYAFDKLKTLNSRCVRIIDYSAAFSNYSLYLYENIFKKFPAYKESLYTERSFLWNDKIIAKFYNEAFLSDHIVVASSFVKRSLTEFGVSAENVSTIPYGSNIKLYKFKYTPLSTLRVLYVGNVSVMKGIPFVLEAIKQIPHIDIQLTFVGAVSEDIIQMAAGDNRCKFVGRIPRDEVKKYLMDADVFVFPSLSDGFGFAPLEAMNYGVPCIVSDNAGISDLITADNGFVVPHGDVKAIKDILCWCCCHRPELLEMRKAAYNTAKECTWERYRLQWDTTIKSLLN